MEDTNYQEQINAINGKLDLILDFVTQQQQKREEIDDLIKDVNIVAKDAFRNTVVMLDKAGVELDSCGLSCLLIKVLQNIGTFHEMLELMESANDFMKDLTPVLHQVGLDAVNKMNELDQKGYFEYMRHMGRIADKWVQSFTPEDMQNIEANIGTFAGIVRRMTDPALVASLDRMTKVLAETRMDDKTDNKTLWQLMKEIRSPEVRKTLSYSLKLVKEIAKWRNSEIAK